MKKRIEENGVIYTIDENNGDCIDIGVKPGVEEVSFEASFGREYLLGDCKKVFPDVRKNLFAITQQIFTTKRSFKTDFLNARFNTNINTVTIVFIDGINHTIFFNSFFHFFCSFSC